MPWPRACGWSRRRWRPADPVRGAAVSPALEGTPRGQALKLALAARGVRLVEVAAGRARRAGRHRAPAGRRRGGRAAGWSLADCRRRPARVVLVLDAVQDPGNVGTMLRTALGLGAAGVIALKGTAELTNPKVLRGSMGAVFRLPAVAADAEVPGMGGGARRGALGRRRRRRAARHAAAGGPAAVALVVGNEGAGVSAALCGAARPAGGDSARAPGPSRSTSPSPPASFCTRSRVTTDRHAGAADPVAFAGLLGAMIGSFLNVCILRWGAEPKQSVVRPPSRCPQLRARPPLVRQRSGRLVAPAPGPLPRLPAADFGAVSADRAGDGAASGPSWPGATASSSRRSGARCSSPSCSASP